MRKQWTEENMLAALQSVEIKAKWCCMEMRALVTRVALVAEAILATRVVLVTEAVLVTRMVLETGDLGGDGDGDITPLFSVEEELRCAHRFEGL